MYSKLIHNNSECARFSYTCACAHTHTHTTVYSLCIAHDLSHIGRHSEIINAGSNHYGSGYGVVQVEERTDVADSTHRAILSGCRTHIFGALLGAYEEGLDQAGSVPTPPKGSDVIQSPHVVAQHKTSHISYHCSMKRKR